MAQLPLEDRIIIMCNNEPKIAEILSLALEVEQSNDYAIQSLGWEWSHVRAPAHLLRKLVLEGIIDIKYSSRSGTHYRLKDPQITKTALEKYQVLQEQFQIKQTPEIPADLFSTIVGYDDIKHWFSKSLNISGEKPVHILLIGPPASAKSMFLMEIGRIQGAAYYSGTAATKAGIQRFLADTRPAILILDEIDRMDDRDQSALYTVMESGIIAELKTGRVRVERVPVKIYAAGNTIETLGAALRSRFLPFHFKSYSTEEFKEVVASVLVAREGKSKEMAEYIADRLSTTTRDPRDAVKISRLTENRSEVDALLQTLYTHR